MSQKQFVDYLFNLSQTAKDLSITAILDKTDIEMIKPNQTAQLSIMYRDNKLAWYLEGFHHQTEHRKAFRAFVDEYNERPDKAFRMSQIVNGDKIVISGMEAAVQDEQAIAVIDKAVKYFTQANEDTDLLSKLLVDAKARWNIINARVKKLRTRACDLEAQGDHAKAMQCYRDICGKYYGWNHMEIIALGYGSGKPTNVGTFPKNPEYQLECQMLAVKNSPDNIYAPMIAYRLADELGKTELCRELEAIGQKRGTWNAIVLHRNDGVQVFADKIARYYREGVGCEANETHARYYERLVAGERQQVFKDMLENGFEPVFELMTARDFYSVQSLAELSGLSEAFQDRILYGDDIERRHLPEWFVPFVNGLNERDRAAVLLTAKDRLLKAFKALRNDIVHGAAHIIMPFDEHGALLETGDCLTYVYLPNVSGLTDCEAARALQAAIADMPAQFNKLQ